MMRPLRVLLAVFCLTEVKGFTRGALMWQPRGAVPVSARIPLLLRPAALGSLHMAVSGDTDTWVRPEPRGKRDIIFGTLVTASQPVAKEHDEGCNLGTYMQLPTDQYVLIPLPNNAKLEKQSEDLFTLLVPELQLFNVWLRPHVVSKVEVTPDGVLIEAVECRLDGSPEVQRLDLNSKFELSVKVVLQGIQDPRGLRNVMTARSEITVWVDPPPIFRLLFPKPLMVSTGNAVVKASLRLLQSTFLQGLASDYNRWALDAKYRDERSSS
mmetsp:Transcript_53688/g.78663  ORF Transcript_53688/g.78663 Transcript_53688/m.78663 type:complete len:268 (+) Transcript_53688:50-853(+)|eukprot:CAMPEP_0179431150 /NCGR_PEP_ID=MMETSP0799-20121207/16107_1 /TAXON_ID=46947 /ORGANISM="Geminigera cryophila, Strain CCMP2564" /LENGTH=267 /DNA_ID=CAMNT_0021207927 /DNA_START=55 /DNA_END=858 /DNA_ORIENTATION=+